MYANIKDKLLVKNLPIKLPELNFRIHKRIFLLIEKKSSDSKALEVGKDEYNAKTVERTEDLISFLLQVASEEVGNFHLNLIMTDQLGLVNSISGAAEL